MNYQEFLPSPQLKAFVDHIWINQFELAQTDTKEIIIPDGMTELVFNFGNDYERGVIGSDTVQNVAGSHIIGIKSKSHYVKASTGMNTLGIRFKPGGLSAFSKIPAAHFKDQCISAYEVFGNSFKDLELSVYKSSSSKDKLDLIEKYLLTRLKETKDNYLLNDWINTIYNNPQKNKVTYLYENNDLNYKQLERKFIQYLGITPKCFWKIIRFNNTLRIWSNSKESNFTNLAYNAGYADQSHLIKEFKGFTHKSPGEFFQSESQFTKVIQNTINKQMSNLYNPVS